MKRYGAITALIPLLALFFCIGLDNPFDPNGPGYERATFAVAFSTNGGIPLTILPVTVDSGAELGTRYPADPTREGYLFGGWFDEDDNPYDSLTTITKITVLSAKWIDTVFFKLTVNKVPADGGEVSREPDEESYTAGTKVTLTAAANDGYRFTGWSGLASADSTKDTIVVTISGNLTLTANFEKIVVPPDTFTLTVRMNPEGGGTFTLDPHDEQGRYEVGTVVTVTVETDDDYEFTGWSGASTSRNTEVKVTMTRDTTLTANFKRVIFTDPRDGQKYGMLKIGDLTWMARNLNFIQDEEISLCYEYNPANCDKYGRLYDWSAAQTACPVGWRLPDHDDLNNLIVSAGDMDEAAYELKSVNWSGIDQYGFGALGGGLYSEIHLDSYPDKFGKIDEIGYWWTAVISSHEEDNGVYVWEMWSGNNQVNYFVKDGVVEGFAISVRCVQGTLK